MKGNQLSNKERSRRNR